MGIDSIINTLYLTFAHNQYAIAFFVGIIFSILLIFTKPSRRAALLLIGFSLLLLGFEYEKHIMEPLMAQTIESLGVSETGKSGIVLVRLFQKLLPFGFFLSGWGSIFVVIFLNYFRPNQSKPNSTNH